MKPRTVPIERLHELLSYDPATGELTWKTTRRGRGSRAGSPAGGSEPRGYRRLGIDYTSMWHHRVIWAMVYGYWPTVDIDHRDGDKSNNRLDNLRLATRKQNIANSNLSRRNKSGFKGVSFDKQTGRWFSCLGVTEDGKRKTLKLGRFDTPEEAAAAYAKAASAKFGQFHRT